MKPRQILVLVSSLLRMFMTTTNTLNIMYRIDIPGVVLSQEPAITTSHGGALVVHTASHQTGCAQ